ncbi:hypothetical protein RSOLAG22IIIB_08984 [Rhizoctonia solani]|uniref:Ubiquinol-cytochrome C reductase hinge domain-containing protein n=1 Tax=Rhizoctonia solani TaxID=456999 RepID=A0A0K6FWP6_9AGAM|nr:hypothetical protein RSOLAG22IIIB_08984 [Rhizoctonia solani]
MTFWSSLFPTAHAEEENPPKEEEKAQEEEEEDEPEDVLPGLQEECKQTAACSGFDKHFVHCTEKVTAGQGFKGEDCVEELCDPSHALRRQLRRSKTIQQTPLDYPIRM